MRVAPAAIASLERYIALTICCGRRFPPMGIASTHEVAPQQWLNAAPPNLSERDLRENFLVPFATIIKLADPAAIMPAYIEVEEAPSHANRALVTGAGRDRLGFKTAYFSHYDGVSNLITEHHLAADNDEAAILALGASVEVELPERKAFAGLRRLVETGRVLEKMIDATVARVLTLKFETELLENPYVDAKLAARSTHTKASAALARKVAQKSVALLKHEGILPLDPKARIKLAVIGPNAADPMFGGYSRINAKAVGVLDGRRHAGTSANVEYAEGVQLVETGKGAYLGPPFEMVGLFIKKVPEEKNVARIREAIVVVSWSDIIVLLLGEAFTIYVDGKNTGRLPGDEVFQFYIRNYMNSVPRPVPGLKYSERLSLRRGDTKPVSFQMDPDALSFLDISMEWAFESGTFTSYTGVISAQLQSANPTVLTMRGGLLRSARTAFDMPEYDRSISGSATSLRPSPAGAFS